MRYLFFVLCCILCSSGQSQLVEPFHQEVVGEGWLGPVQILFAKDGTGFVVERYGKVWILDKEGIKLPQPLVNISEEIIVFGDHGLLSMALHPNFLNNGYFYLLYVVDRHHLLHFGTSAYDPTISIPEQATIGRITRYTADPATQFTTTIPGSRKVILGDTPQSGFPILMQSHGIGTLAFGTDGTLFASCGDSGSFLSTDTGNAAETYFEQALLDGIIRPKENIGSLRAQLVDCLNGKIIRIDPETGAGLRSNPFYDSLDPQRPASKVWALGFRQPYRFSVKPESGSHYPEDGRPGVLFVGDVGSSKWEELNVVSEGGMNFGWPLYEGFDVRSAYADKQIPNPDAPNPLFNQDSCHDAYFTFDELVAQPLQDTQPILLNPCDSSAYIPGIYAFTHAIPVIAWSNEKYNTPTRAMVAHWDSAGALNAVSIESPQSLVQGKNFDGSSSIPGFFYTGPAYPEGFTGKFFQCDFSGWIRVLDFDETYRLRQIDSFHTDIEFIVDVAQNPVDGNLYHVNMFHQVFKVTYGGNVPPEPVILADTLFGPSPLTVRFDGSSSFDVNGDPFTWLWDFGDGATSDLPAPLHVFAAPGNTPRAFPVTLTVTDTSGATRQNAVVVSVNNTPPNVSITSVKDGSYYTLSGTTYLPLEARVTDFEHQDEALAYEWQVFLHHNDHFHAEFPDGSRISHAVIAPAGCNGESYFYRIRLEVQDGAGLSGSDEVRIYPWCGEDILTFNGPEAVVLEDRVSLNWSVESASGPMQYSVERAPRFGSFLEIGMAGNGTFSFDDLNPLHGENTYRIKAKRADGLYMYSSSVHAAYPLPPRYTIFPNPASGQINLRMPSTQSTQVSLTLFNPSGKRVLGRTWVHSQVQIPLEKTIPVDGLAHGLHYFRLDDGDAHFHGTLMIVH